MLETEVNRRMTPNILLFLVVRSVVQHKGHFLDETQLNVQELQPGKTDSSMTDNKFQK